jgi:hypothetical protein
MRASSDAWSETPVQVYARSIDKAKIIAVLASRAIDSLRAAVLLADG